MSLAVTVATTNKQWMDLPLDLMGRANVLKMILLPKLLYVMANSPCKISKAIFKTYCIIIIYNVHSVLMERLPS